METGKYMKIQHTNIGGPGTEGAERSQASGSHPRGGSTDEGREAGAGGDRISLSNLSQQLHALSPEREKRITALSAAYDSGSYNFNAADLSRRIVQEAMGEF